MVARVLVLLSDGQNNAGEVTLRRAIDARKKLKSPSIAISTKYTRTRRSRDPAADEVIQIFGSWQSRPVGGAVPGGPKDVAKAFAKIEEELRSRYAVSYKPSEFTPDGHYRAIKIEPRKAETRWRFRARKGYYARARPGSAPIPQKGCAGSSYCGKAMGA